MLHYCAVPIAAAMVQCVVDSRCGFSTGKCMEILQTPGLFGCVDEDDEMKHNGIVSEHQKHAAGMSSRIPETGSKRRRQENVVWCAICLPVLLVSYA